MSDLRRALEDALTADPDDVAAHMAYADYLQEQGDPRGEFIQVQLALEDESKPAAERKQLQKREKQLLKQHGHEWLGGLAPYLIDQQQEPKTADWQPDAGYGFQLRRGWLDSLELTYYRVAFMRLLVRAPQLRLLRRLVLNESYFEEPGDYEGATTCRTARTAPRCWSCRAARTWATSASCNTASRSMTTNGISTATWTASTCCRW